ncbi:MAG: universal stress protein [Actinomycetota bacterium]
MSEIVVGVDGSEVGMLALRWAAEEAALRRQPLKIVHALQRWLYDMPEDAAHAEVGRWAREDANRMLDEAAGVAREVGPRVKVTTELLAGDARPMLLDAAGEDAVLVVGGRGEGGFTGLLLGSVAYGVSSRTRGPVVVVQHPVPSPEGEVVVGVDGSAETGPALEAAFAEAEMRGVPLRTVYAWRQLGWAARHALPHAGAATDVHADEGEARRTLAAAVSGAAARYPGVRVVEELDLGHPTEALVRASSAAALLVVGRRGAGGFPTLRIGSVSRGVLHHAVCPVMIVPR